jgi:hypothetical protein
MAIDKEFLETHFQGVEKADEHISAIIAEHDKEKIAILKNRDDMAGEKKAADKKLAELQERFTGLETANKELNEKLESGLPDKEKQVFQAELEKNKANIIKITDEYNKAKAEYEEKISTLSKEKTDYIIGEEFSKLVNANPAIFSFMKDGLHKRFFADYPKSGFEPFEYGGKSEFVNKDGKKMADLLNDFLSTEEGKHYLQNTSTGGGAVGGSSQKGFNGKNPWVKESRNLTEQARILNENPNLAVTLKAQAGVS